MQRITKFFTLMTPDFNDYLQKRDLAGYLKALWKNANNGDIGSLHALLYLAIRCSEGSDAMQFMKQLCDQKDKFGTFLTDLIVEQSQKLPKEDQEDDDKLLAMFKVWYAMALSAFPKHPDYEEIWGRNHNDLLRAYLNGIGENDEDEVPDATGVVADPSVEVPADQLRDWQLYYTRSDASSTLMGIYQGAIPYAKQGHPFAMFVVGYLLMSGIRTAYSSPSVEYLKPNRDAALPWLEKAAEAGIQEAYDCVIRIYYGRANEGGEEERAEAQRKADEWIDRGAALNDEASVEKLFKRYEEAQEWEKAFPLLVRLANEFNSHEHRLELAKWYREGKGCEKDDKQALEQVEYVYNHSSASPYSSDYDDSAELLYDYLMEGIGCEKDVDRAIAIRRKLKDDWDYLEEVLSR